MNKGNKIFILIVAVIVAASVWAIMASSSNSGSGDKTQRADAERLVRSDSYRIGPASAKVTIVEFGDYQCPACGAADPMMKKILQDNPENIALVFRHLPLPGRLNALGAAVAAEAAGEQGKYWEMHHALYEKQSQWAAQENPQELFIGYARDLGLGVEKFASDQSSQKYISKIRRDVADAEELRIRATPTFFINGLRHEGVPTADFTNILNEELAKN